MTAIDRTFGPVDEASAPLAATEADAARALAKARRRLLPFLFLLYIVAYLDRVNVGFAALQMNADLGFSSAVYGLGAGIFFVSYTLFEVPSNLLLLRFGARVWIARIMISWGIVSAAMMFVTGTVSFYTLRLLLGAGEAGFFPGIILYLTYWFPAAERARATAYFMTAVALSGVVGGPISGALLTLNGFLGLAGWQWLFLLEGVPAIVLGIVVMMTLPNGPGDAKWLSGSERAALEEILERDRAAGGFHRHHHRLADALRSGRVWLLCFLYFCLVVGLYGLSFWLPQILRAQSGWSDLRVGFVSTLPYIAAALAMVVVAAHSDRTGERRWHTAVPMWIGAAGFLIASQTASGWGALAAMTVCAMLLGGLGPFWTMPTAFLRGTAAAGGIALVNSIGNVGGFAGPSIIGFARNGTGRFGAGLIVVAIVLIAGGVLAITARRDGTR